MLTVYLNKYNNIHSPIHTHHMYIIISSYQCGHTSLKTTPHYTHITFVYIYVQYVIAMPMPMLHYGEQMQIGKHWNSSVSCTSHLQMDHAPCKWTIKTQRCYYINYYVRECMRALAMTIPVKLLANEAYYITMPHVQEAMAKYYVEPCKRFSGNTRTYVWGR